MDTFGMSPPGTGSVALPQGKLESGQTFRHEKRKEPMLDACRKSSGVSLCCGWQDSFPVCDTSGLENSTPP